MWRAQHLLLLLALAGLVGTRPDAPQSLHHCCTAAHNPSTASQTVLPGYEHSVKLRKSPYYVLHWSVANETLRVGVVAETRRGAILSSSRAKVAQLTELVGYVAIGWGPKDHGHLEVR